MLYRRQGDLATPRAQRWLLDGDAGVLSQIAASGRGDARERVWRHVDRPVCRTARREHDISGQGVRYYRAGCEALPWYCMG